MKRARHLSFLAFAIISFAMVVRVADSKSAAEAHRPEYGGNQGAVTERSGSGAAIRPDPGPDSSSPQKSGLRTVSDPNGNDHNAVLLTETEALEIAKRQLGDYGYDHNAPIKVTRDGDWFVFEFPEPPHGEPGEWLGADFAARVRVNAKTGMTDDIEVGG